MIETNKLALLIFFTLSFFILFSSNVSAATIPSPTYEFFVGDFAGVFTADEQVQLLNTLSALQTNTTAEVVVVTVESVEDLTPQQYATQLGQAWGVGKADVDNGLVILYAKQENKIFAATGYGLEGILPDSKLGRMLDEYYVPLRDLGNVKQGIIDFTNAIAQEIIINKAEVGSKQPAASGTVEDILSVAWIFFIEYFVLTLIFIGIAIFLKEKMKITSKIIALITMILSIGGMFIALFATGALAFVFVIIFMLIFSIASNILGLKGSSGYYGGGGWHGGGGHSFGGGGFSGGGGFHGGGGGFGGGGAGR